MRFRSSVVAALIVSLVAGSAAQTKAPGRVFLYDINALNDIRAALVSGNKEYAPAIARLKRDAEKAMSFRPVFVVEKERMPPSGNKHDYLSMGKYWWPDPAKPDGLPYIRRDGEVNPESETISDADNLGKTIGAVTSLSLAYFFTGEERYADRAAMLMRGWFLDSTTRMNPHLEYAQFVPGRSDGRGFGIIDAHRLVQIVESIGLITSSNAWTPQDDAGMKEWFREYLTWLRTSKNGVDESNAKNNHGTWYDVQVVSIALYLGDAALAREVIEESKSKRIAAHFEPDGKQPLELARTRSFSYSMFNLLAHFHLAELAKKLGVDLWNYSTPDGRGIRKGLDYLLPYVEDRSTWEHEQIIEINPRDLLTLLRWGAVAYGDERYARLSARIAGIDKKTFDEHVSALLFPFRSTEGTR